MGVAGLAPSSGPATFATLFDDLSIDTDDLVYLDDLIPDANADTPVVGNARYPESTYPAARFPDLAQNNDILLKQERFCRLSLASHRPPMAIAKLHP